MADPSKPRIPVLLEDIAVGDVWTSGSILISEEAIIRFGTEFDPQPFHTDPVAAKASVFGSLIASGWHVSALVMRSFVDADIYGGTPIVGIGVDELRWLEPVRAGDRLTVRREVVAVTRSTRKPDRGTVRSAVTVTNQDGRAVMGFGMLTRIPARNSQEISDDE